MNFLDYIFKSKEQREKEALEAEEKRDAELLSLSDKLYEEKKYDECLEVSMKLVNKSFFGTGFWSVYLHAASILYNKGRYKEVLEVNKHYHPFCDRDADQKMEWYVSYSQLAIAEQENPKPKPKPQPKPQPQPINPIEEVPISPVAPEQPSVSFSFFGTTDKVRFDKKNSIRLATLNENAIADAWVKLSEEGYTNLIHDCLEIRKQHELCDWAYLMMLQDMAGAIFGKGTNESVLLMTYVYCQSGYQIRMAIDGSKLILLAGSKHHIFDLPYFTIDGSNFYPILRKGETMHDRVQICGASFPQEKPMSLLVPKAQEFAANYNGERTIKSERYTDVVAKIIPVSIISFILPAIFFIIMDKSYVRTFTVVATSILSTSEV